MAGGRPLPLPPVPVPPPPLPPVPAPPPLPEPPAPAPLPRPQFCTFSSTTHSLVAHEDVTTMVEVGMPITRAKSFATVRRMTTCTSVGTVVSAAARLA
jgi:hypothetical protein